MIERLSPNRDARPAPVDMLVLHYTGMESAEAAVARLADPAARVSAHYVVDEDGTVVRMVPEAERAWHAGVSCWAGRERLNDVSVGIEIVNPGHEWGYRPFPACQMQAVARLARAVVQRHHIPAWRVVAHSDIAPDRKTDPGELFDWRALAAAGVGLWPEIARPAAPDAPANAGALAAALAAFGYCPHHGTAAVTAAFQRRFRPRRIDGLADAECLALARALVALRHAAA